MGCISKIEIEKTAYTDLIEKVQNLKDSIMVGNTTIHNAFKHQLLAHQTQNFNTQLTNNKGYILNSYVFNSCLGEIFGEENREKFQPEGMFAWNEKLLDDNIDLIRKIPKTMMLQVITKFRMRSIFCSLRPLNFTFVRS